MIPLVSFTFVLLYPRNLSIFRPFTSLPFRTRDGLLTVSAVITDPEDPHFDLEKLIAKYEKSS